MCTAHNYDIRNMEYNRLLGKNQYIYNKYKNDYL